MGADGGTGPSSSSRTAASSESLKRETAPYPSVPATAKMARFWSIVEAEEDDGDGDGFVLLVLPLPLLVDENNLRRQFVRVWTVTVGDSREYDAAYDGSEGCEERDDDARRISIRHDILEAAVLAARATV